MSQRRLDAGLPLQTYPLALLGGRRSGLAQAAELPPRTTGPFSLIGVTWTDPAKTLSGVTQIRTRSLRTGRWSSWQALEADGSGSGDARGSTDPLWTGDSNGVQARVAGATRALPAGLRVDLINPNAEHPRTANQADAVNVGGASEGVLNVGGASAGGVNVGAVNAGAVSAGGVDVGVASASGIDADETDARVGNVDPSNARVDLVNMDGGHVDGVDVDSVNMDRFVNMSGGAARRGVREPVGRVAVGAVPLPARPVPRMVTRAGWGADEAIVKGTPEFTGPIRVFFVHHTATGNAYSCADSARIVRGIQAYQVRSKGWDDIGYNFLVDKCGNVFEGRVGGVGRSVLGAHTLGFNTDASAIAVIGTYDTAGVSARVRTAIAAVAAYKLGAFGNSPTGTVTLVSGGSDRFPKGMRVTLNRISGHRDTGRTECPGDALYAQLPEIRAIAGAAPVGLRLLRMTGAVRHGSTLFTKGVLKPLWDLNTPSALIDRFEIWVDGRLVVAAPGTYRTTAVRLAPGGHTVTIRALHLSGRSTAVTTEVVADPDPPVFSAGPDVVLRPGSLASSVPIRLDWTATDANGLASVRLLRPTAADLGTVAHSRDGTLRPAVPATFTVQATDRAGNAVSASVTRTPVVLSEAVAARTGTWRVLRNPAYLGGVALGSTGAGASATWTFTGRSAALVVGRGAASGRVRIFVDGEDQGLVDLRSATTVYRQAVWSRWWSESGEHTVSVRLEGTAGRPGAVLDGLVYLK